MRNVLDTLEMLQDLGFVIHAKKSVLIPTRCITFLGFIFDTKNMTITLTEEKKNNTKMLAKEILDTNVSIRVVSRFIGNLTNSFDGVPEGKLYYRHIEYHKNVSIKIAKGDYDGACHLSNQALDEVVWWYYNIDHAHASIKSTPMVDYFVHTDASNEGWGASDVQLPDINGRWAFRELQFHITCLNLGYRTGSKIVPASE